MFSLTEEEFQDVKSIIASNHLDVKQEVTGPQEFADEGRLRPLLNFICTYKWYFYSISFWYCVVFHLSILIDVFTYFYLDTFDRDMRLALALSAEEARKSKELDIGES